MLLSLRVSEIGRAFKPQSSLLTAEAGCLVTTSYDIIASCRVGTLTQAVWVHGRVLTRRQRRAGSLCQPATSWEGSWGRREGPAWSGAGTSRELGGLVGWEEGLRERKGAPGENAQLTKERYPKEPRDNWGYHEHPSSLGQP